MKLFKSIIFSILLLSTAYSQEAVDTSIPEVIIEVPEIIPNLNITQSGEYPEFLTLRGDFQRLKRKTGNGKGVKVGVVDTGLDSIHAQKGRDLELYDGSNPDTYRVREVKDFTGSRIQPHWGDRSSHGSHVAAHIGAAANGRGIEGIASDCDLYIAKGLGDKGFGSDTQISRAINWLISKDVDIINLSLGGGFSQRIENAVLKARRAGIIVFAAIGNNGNMGDGHPGNSGHTLGIAAVNYQFELASFSSRSNRALMSGFGVNVYSCMKGGSYGALSGTSMATPDQVGIAALIIGYLRLNGIEIKDTLDYWTLVKRSIIDLGPKGLDRGYGYGFLDVWKVIDHIDRNILPERPTNPRPPPTSPTPPKEPPTNPPVNPYQGYEKVGGINTEQWGDYIILKRKSKESKTIKRLPANRIEDLILPVIDTIKPCPIETGG